MEYDQWKKAATAKSKSEKIILMHTNEKNEIITGELTG